VGDEADAIYLVVEGLLSVSPQDAAGQQTVMTELGPGDIAGMVQILTGGRRSATLRAVTASRLIRFSKEVFERLAETETPFIDRVRTLALQYLRRIHLASILPAQFGDLDFRQMEEIESLGRRVTLQKGQDLFRQGDQGDGAYVLVSGLLGVLVRKPDGTDRLVNYIRS